MTSGGERKGFGPNWRIALLALAMVASLALLARRLHGIQVVESRAYAGSQMRQSVRRVQIPAPRGRIFDRDGVCLADNRPSFCIALFIEDLRRPGAWSNTVNAVDASVERLSEELGIPRQISREDIHSHVFRQLPLPLLAWQDVDERTLARFSERVTPNAGMDVYVQPERVYPLGRAAAHLVGYVGRDRPQSPTNEVSHYTIMGMKGRSGVERARNDDLAGTPGGKLITVDVSGYRHSETNRPAKPGRDVRLTVLSRLQIRCEELLGGRKAAVVAVDPRNGDILALSSEPAYDLNTMSPSVPGPVWRALLNDPDTPLLNRAVTGVYPPGSTFKPAVALAALGLGVSPGYAVDCTGVYTLGAMRLKCAARYGHGPGLDMHKALSVSCNPYFCTLGVHIGAEAIGDFARRLGFGRRTGIGLGGESAGLVPDDLWKRSARREGWRAGDTANMAIGQGYLLVTPLQLAMYASVIANGGTLYRPRLYADEPVAVASRLDIPLAHLEVVRRAMRDVVNAPRAGGRRARLKEVTVAAKTGTAEYGSRSNRRKHTWMIAYAPFEAPEIALAVLVEDGESGGLTAAPVVAALLRTYFGLPDVPVEDDDGVSEYAEADAAHEVAAPVEAAPEGTAGPLPEPQSPEPQSPEPQSPEPLSTEPQSTELQSPEPQPPEAQSPESQPPEPQPSESQSTESQEVPAQMAPVLEEEEAPDED